jgi:hypothetical protein
MHKKNLILKIIDMLQVSGLSDADINTYFLMWLFLPFNIMCCNIYYTFSGISFKYDDYFLKRIVLINVIKYNTWHPRVLVF